MVLSILPLVLKTRTSTERMTQLYLVCFLNIFKRLQKFQCVIFLCVFNGWLITILILGWDRLFSLIDCSQGRPTTSMVTLIECIMIINVLKCLFIWLWDLNYRYLIVLWDWDVFDINFTLRPPGGVAMMLTILSKRAHPCDHQMRKSHSKQTLALDADFIFLTIVTFCKLQKFVKIWEYDKLHSKN